MVDIETNMKSLSSVAILEKDTNNDVLAVWSYPEMSTEFENLLISRSNLSLDSIPVQFSYSRFKNEWIYIYIHLAQKRNVVAFAVTLVATDFNPEKYSEFAKLLCNLYASTSDPVSVLECWLSVFTKGSFQGDKLGNFSVTEHDPRKALLATSIKDVIRMFGEEVILLWSALLTKKRILVYSEKLGFLLKFIRALPLFVFYRQNWTILRPFVNMNEDMEVNELKVTGVYVAGVTTNCKDREDLYDLYIDVGNKSISIASHAKTEFLMTSIHKDICQFLVDSEDLSDQEIIKGLTVKTKELLSKLETLKVEHEDGLYIDYKTLQNTKLPANMDTFLYAVATAEGLTKL